MSIKDTRFCMPVSPGTHPENFLSKSLYIYTVFKISAGPRTLTGKIWVGPASFPSLSYINFGKIVLRSGKFQILFWRLYIQQILQSFLLIKSLTSWMISHDQWFILSYTFILHCISTNQHNQRLILFIFRTLRDNFVCTPSQWETTLHCNVVSHCLGAYTKWSLRHLLFLSNRQGTTQGQSRYHRLWPRRWA